MYWPTPALSILKDSMRRTRNRRNPDADRRAGKPKTQRGRATVRLGKSADLAVLKTPFRAHGKVTAGNAAGLNDGATACLLASEEAAAESAAER